MQKRVCLITGATEGVGKVTATELARIGFAVVMAVRNAAKGELVKAEIVALTGNPDVDYICADLKSLTQVHGLAGAFRERYARLDVLINNAGIVAPSRELTEDGYETTYQVNYLSHFLLTNLLLETLKGSRQGRVINLTSSAYAMGKFDAQNIQSEKRFSPMGAYTAAKLFVIMSTIKLASNLRDTSVTVNAVHPGNVRTKMMTEAPGMLRVIGYAVYPFAVPAEQGAATSVYLAAAEDAAALSGKYFVDRMPADVKNKFNTPGNRELLLNDSIARLRAFGLVHAS